MDEIFNGHRSVAGPDGREVFAMFLWTFVVEQGLKVEFYKYQMERLSGTGHKEDPEMPDNV
jgi:hypothetical protein